MESEACGSQPRPGERDHPPNRARRRARSGACVGARPEAPDAKFADQPAAHENETLAAVGRGDREAEAKLVAINRTRLLKLFLRWMPEDPDAEDLCHDCLLVTLERLRGRGLDEPEKLEAFLRGVANNLVRAHRRAPFERIVDLLDRDSLDAFTSDAEDPLAAVERSEWLESLRAAIARLRRERDHEILLRSYLLDEDASSVRAALRLTPTGYRKALQRARWRVRRLLDSPDRPGSPSSGGEKRPQPEDTQHRPPSACLSPCCAPLEPASARERTRRAGRRG